MMPVLRRQAIDAMQPRHLCAVGSQAKRRGVDLSGVPDNAVPVDHPCAMCGLSEIADNVNEERFRSALGHVCLNVGEVRNLAKPRRSGKWFSDGLGGALLRPPKRGER